MGMGDAYFPCNKPAEFIVGWRGRPDTPIRMCLGCADHNVRNRSGVATDTYPPSAPRRDRSFTAYSVNVLTGLKEALPPRYYAALVAEAQAPKAPYVVLALNMKAPIGTVKSRLHRGRAAMEKILAAGPPAADGVCGLCEKPAKVGKCCPNCGTDTVSAAPAQSSTVLGSV